MAVWFFVLHKLHLLIDRKGIETIIIIIVDLRLYYKSGFVYNFITFLYYYYYYYIKIYFFPMKKYWALYPYFNLIIKLNHVQMHIIIMYNVFF